jgi:hypothetical protein
MKPVFADTSYYVALLGLVTFGTIVPGTSPKNCLDASSSQNTLSLRRRA